MTDRNYRTGKEYTRERAKVLRALVKKHNLTLAEAGALYGLTKQRVRLHEHAQYEIRVYAQALLELIKPVVPVAVAAFEKGQ